MTDLIKFTVSVERSTEYQAQSTKLLALSASVYTTDTQDAEVTTTYLSQTQVDTQRDKRVEL